MPSLRMAGQRFGVGLVCLLPLWLLTACSKAYCQQGYWERVIQGSAGNPMMLGPSMAASGILELTCDDRPSNTGASSTTAIPTNNLQNQSEDQAKLQEVQSDPVAQTKPAEQNEDNRCRWIAQEHHWQCW